MRVAFKTLGCRLNQAETAALTALIKQAGCRIVPFGQPCEVCIIHSCAVTAEAERKTAHYARFASRLSGRPRVVVIGCGVDAKSRTLMKHAETWTLLPNAEKFNILNTLGFVSSENTKEYTETIPHFNTVRALLRVQTGCNFNCAYCMVPLLRGMPQSRPAITLINEARALAEAGYREIVITGTNLGTYSDGDVDLVTLIQQIEAIPSIQRIRLSSIELTTVERKLVDYMASSPKLCRYLHVPLQTADDSLLKAMGRRYNSMQYRKFMEYALNKIDELGFGTDVIVGLPGETEKTFENTRRFISEMPFSNLHVFPYSKRSGTRACTMSGHVQKHEKKLWVEIMRLLRMQKIETFAKKFINKKLSVLVEDIRYGRAYGWSSQYIQCEINMSTRTLLVNDIVPFIPTAWYPDMLTGHI